MQPLDEIKKYSHTVCTQIRWKKAKPIIATEIENHLYDQRDAYIIHGDNEKNATDKAIAQMGDAVLIGQQLDKTHKPKPQWAMIILTGILMAMGVFVHYVIDTSPNSLNTFSILPFVVAFGVFILCYYLDFTILGKYPMIIYYAVLSFSIIGILLSTRLSSRLVWHIGRFSISSSYLSLIFPLAFSLLVYKMRKKGYRGILLSGIGFLPLAAILMMIPTATGLILYTSSALILLCFAIWKGWFGVSKKHGLLLVLIPTFTVSVLAAPFIIKSTGRRINIFLDPSKDRLGSGYHYCIIRDFLSESIFFGKGNIPPDAYDISNLTVISSDYSLVYLIHQLGFVVLLGITVLIVLFAMIGIYKTLKQKSVLGSLTALGIMLTFVFQSVFYILDNLGYGLVSSLSLPFISYRSPALFINAALVGFMLSVFRTGDVYKDNITSLKKNHSFFSYENGKLIIDLKQNKL